MPFRRGAFDIALKSGAKVQPVVVQNYRMIDHKKHHFGRGQVEIQYLPPLNAMKDETAAEFAERAHKIMNFEFQKLNGILDGQK